MAAESGVEASVNRRFRELIDEHQLVAAEEMARRILADAQGEHGEPSLPAAQARDLLAEALWRQKHYEIAEMHARKAVAAKKALLPSGDPEIGRSLAQLGSMLRRSESFDEAEVVLKEALEIMENALPPGDPELAEHLNSLGNLYLVLHRVSEARPLYERAIALLEKAPGSKPHELAHHLYNLASVLRRLGDFEAAGTTYQKALEAKKSDPKLRPVDLSPYLNGMAILAWNTGDYLRARDLWDDVLSLRRETLGLDHPDVASTLNNLGLLLREMGDHPEARRVFEEALRIRELHFKSNHSLVAQSRHNLAVTLFQLGDREKARNQFDRALEVNREIFGDESQVVATSHLRLGDVLLEIGAFAEAQKEFESARLISAKADAELDEAWSAHGLGVAAAGRGDHLESIAHLQEALAIRRRTLGERQPLVAETRLALAISLARTGRAAEARQEALAAEESAREHVVLTLRTLAERQAMRYASYRVSGLDVALSLLGRSSAPEDVATTFDALIRSRAVVLDEMASRHRSIENIEDPDVRRLRTELAAARRDLARLALLDPQTTGVEDYRQVLKQAAKRKERAEGNLARISLAFRADLGQARAGLREIRRALPAKSTLIAYVQYDRYDLDVGSSGVPVAHPHYGAFVVSGAEGEPRFVPLGGAAEIDQIIDRWHYRVARPDLSGGATAAGIEASYRDVGARVSLRVWQPVAPDAGFDGVVFVVPDGEINRVSFASLPEGAGYLAEQPWTPHTLSAERDLVRSNVTHGVGLLAVGGPDFDLASPARATSSAASSGSLGGVRRSSGACGRKQLVFHELPQTINEGREIVQMWRDLPAAGPAELLSGERATEAIVKARVNGKRVIHLATHGFFLSGCTYSPLRQDGPGDAVTSSADVRRTRRSATDADNPLVLAGLALSGANNRDVAGPDQEDGVLTAEEVAGLDLRGVEWVVLSACDTGLGEVRAGEGVLGLRRAFQVAGAATVIMSLWSIDDASARQWMRALYRKRFVEGLETAAAIHAVNRTLIQQRRNRGISTHPFFWGGIVAAGDWR